MTMQNNTQSDGTSGMMATAETEKHVPTEVQKSLPPQRRKRHLRNVLTHIENLDGGPLALLKQALFEKRRVKVLIRSAVQMRSICTGYVIVFDKHMNMALSDVEEVYRNPLLIYKRDKKGKPKKKKKHGMTVQTTDNTNSVAGTSEPCMPEELSSLNPTHLFSGVCNIQTLNPVALENNTQDLFPTIDKINLEGNPKDCDYKSPGENDVAVSCIEQENFCKMNLDGKHDDSDTEKNEDMHNNKSDRESDISEVDLEELSLRMQAIKDELAACSDDSSHQEKVDNKSERKAPRRSVKDRLGPRESTMSDDSSSRYSNDRLSRSRRKSGTTSKITDRENREMQSSHSGVHENLDDFSRHRHHSSRHRDHSPRPSTSTDHSRSRDKNQSKISKGRHDSTSHNSPKRLASKDSSFSPSDTVEHSHHKEHRRRSHSPKKSTARSPHREHHHREHYYTPSRKHHSSSSSEQRPHSNTGRSHQGKISSDKIGSGRENSPSSSRSHRNRSDSPRHSGHRMSQSSDKSPQRSVSPYRSEHLSLRKSRRKHETDPRQPHQSRIYSAETSPHSKDGQQMDHSPRSRRLSEHHRSPEHKRSDDQARTSKSEKKSKYTDEHDFQRKITSKSASESIDLRKKLEHKVKKSVGNADGDHKARPSSSRCDDEHVSSKVKQSVRKRESGKVENSGTKLKTSTTLNEQIGSDNSSQSSHRSHRKSGNLDLSQKLLKKSMKCARDLGRKEEVTIKDNPRRYKSRWDGNDQDSMNKSDEVSGEQSQTSKAQCKTKDTPDVLVRHINQLFIRGDNIVLVALVD